jgi:hypothetical protein
MDLLAARRGIPAGVAWRTAMLAAALGALSARAQTTDPKPEFTGTMNPFLKGAITRAFTLALEKLGRESCLHVFSDFRDRDGHTLTANLDAMAQTARLHLASIRFADGAQYRTCSDTRVFAFTHPRTATVYVCGQRFASLAHTHPALAAALILHEELHVLGLGEDPPKSRDITSSVLQRCGY